jgi:hypothetical protein
MTLRPDAFSLDTEALSNTIMKSDMIMPLNLSRLAVNDWKWFADS